MDNVWVLWPDVALFTSAIGIKLYEYETIWNTCYYSIAIDLELWLKDLAPNTIGDLEYNLT
jgi:hypothetical protein